MKKRYQDGGPVGNLNYPFGQNQNAAAAPIQPASGGTAPLVQVTNAPGQQPYNGTEVLGMKKGGKVKAKKYAIGGATSRAGRQTASNALQFLRAGNPAAAQQALRSSVGLPPAAAPQRPTPVGFQPRRTAPVAMPAMSRPSMARPLKKGGSVKSSASRRADGIAVKGKTKGRII